MGQKLKVMRLCEAAPSLQSNFKLPRNRVLYSLRRIATADASRGASAHGLVLSAFLPRSGNGISQDRNSLAHRFQCRDATRFPIAADRGL